MARPAVVAGFVLAGALVFGAAQDAKAPKSLIRKDLLVFGSVEIAPPIRDIFRPKTVPVPESARPAGRPAAKPGAGVAAPEAPPAFDLSFSYIGSIKSGGRTIALILRNGQTVSVGEGDDIAPGYKVVGVTAEAIVVQGPNGERKTFPRQGERP